MITTLLKVLREIDSLCSGFVFSARRNGKKSNKMKGKNIICNGRGNFLILVVISLVVEKLTIIAASGAHLTIC